MIILYVYKHSVINDVLHLLQEMNFSFLWSNIHINVSGSGRLRGGNRFQLRKKLRVIEEIMD